MKQGQIKPIQGKPVVSVWQPTVKTLRRENQTGKKLCDKNKSLINNDKSNQDHEFSYTLLIMIKELWNLFFDKSYSYDIQVSNLI